MKRTPGKPNKTRRILRVNGYSPHQNLTVFNTDITTLEKAVKERVFFVKTDGKHTPPPKPLSDRYFSETLEPFRAELSKHLPTTAPLSREQFVLSYTGRKAKVYAQALQSLYRQPLKVKDSHITAFIKVEKTNLTVKPTSVPRIIQPRDPRFNVEVGRFLRPLEEEIFEAINRTYGHTTIFKGMNALKSGAIMREKWEQFSDPIAIGADATRFDQHVSQAALSWEHSIYLACFTHGTGREWLAHLLKQQLTNKCKAYAEDGNLRYTTDGCRMSGDMNTSLGNCLLMCAMIYVYAKSVGVRISLANNGDDCVIIMEARDLKKFSANLHDYFLKLGFNLVLEPPTTVFERISFCQTSPVWCGRHEQYIMVRDPRVAIFKDLTCIKYYPTEKLRSGWLYAVGMGGLALAGTMPIWKPFYKSLCVGNKPHESVLSGQSWGVRRLAAGMTYKESPISALTRASFYSAFDITPEEQLASEALYRAGAVNEAPIDEEYLYPYYQQY